MSYLIAAYSIVIATLAAYAWWVQGQRRQLARRTPPDDAVERDA